MRHPNEIEFVVSGDYALFSDPISKTGGELISYPVPTYEALKGVLASIYWKPTLIWHIDEVRVMNKIRTVSKAVRLPKRDKTDLSNFTYLKDCVYQVRAHFEWNENRPELAADRNEGKHFEIAQRMLRRGGRRDIYLGKRECQADVEPCVFGEGESFYDGTGKLDLGFMYHGITYADEAYSEETKGMLTVRFWNAVMEDGVIRFPRPENIPIEMCKTEHEMEIRPFGHKYNNFTGLSEFGGED